MVLKGMLLEHQEKSRWTAGGDFVFCKLDGKPCDPDWLRKKVLRPALRAAEIQQIPHAHGFHIFRHSAGSIVHAETRDLKLTQELLGHTLMSTTSNTYVHLDPRVAEQATEVLAAAIAPGGSIGVQESDKIQ
jgi:integrase